MTLVVLDQREMPPEDFLAAVAPDRRQRGQETVQYRSDFGKAFSFHVRFLCVPRRDVLATFVLASMEGA
ncbi:MAG: hypothetical protein KTR33_03575 [Gammaproteobacteria bacterium]|nr:hypothetical protein [Gammaproteobacteria bacterium]